MKFDDMLKTVNEERLQDMRNQVSKFNKEIKESSETSTLPIGK